MCLCENVHFKMLRQVCVCLSYMNVRADRVEEARGGASYIACSSGR